MTGTIYKKYNDIILFTVSLKMTGDIAFLQVTKNDRAILHFYRLQKMTRTFCIFTAHKKWKANFAFLQFAKKISETKWRRTRSCWRRSWTRTTTTDGRRSRPWRPTFRRRGRSLEDRFGIVRLNKILTQENNFLNKINLLCAQKYWSMSLSAKIVILL